MMPTVLPHVCSTRAMPFGEIHLGYESLQGSLIAGRAPRLVLAGDIEERRQLLVMSLRIY